MVNDSPTIAAAPTSTLRTSQLPSDCRRVCAEMTTTLSAELEGRVPPGLVAEIVRTVLDEGRQSVRTRAVEFIMPEARLRLERFVRARASR